MPGPSGGKYMVICILVQSKWTKMLKWVYIAVKRKCWVAGRKSCGYLKQQQPFEPAASNIQ